MTRLIGLAGPSGAGKSTLCQHLLEAFPQAQLIHLDNYWKDSSTFPSLGEWINWEDPNNLDFELLEKNLQALHAGQSTELPVCTKNQRSGFIRCEPVDLILVEGFLLFTAAKIRELFDTKIYLDLADEIVVSRRVARGRTSSKTEAYYREVAVPEFHRHGAPTKQYADHVIDGSLPEAALLQVVLPLIHPKQ